MFLGVGIDLLILREIINEPSVTNLGIGLLRLLWGIPFFGFGLYLTYLSFGYEK